MPNVNRKAPKKFHWQTILFPKKTKKWNDEKNREAWLEKKACIKSGFHETDDYYRYRQYDPESDKFDYFHKQIDEDVKAICGTPKDEDVKDEANGESTFKCECVDCGFKQSSTQHCRELTCPECGGNMRRQERSGPGQ